MKQIILVLAVAFVLTGCSCEKRPLKCVDGKMYRQLHDGMWIQVGRQSCLSDPADSTDGTL